MLTLIARRARGAALAAVILGAASCGGKVAVDRAPGAGGSGGAGGSLVVPECTPATITVDGTVHGEHLQASPALQSVSLEAGCVTATMQGHGIMRISGPQSFTQDGVVSIDRGWLRLPTTSSAAGSWLCSDAPTAVTVAGFESPSPSQTASFAWWSLRDLGPCPGAPVDASLVWTPMMGLTGKLDGAPIDIPWKGTATSDNGAWQIHDLGDCGLLEMSFATEPANGVIIMPPGGPDAGAIYCVGGVEPQGAGFALLEVTRLGTCSEGKEAGAVGVCAWL